MTASSPAGLRSSHIPRDPRTALPASDLRSRRKTLGLPAAFGPRAVLATVVRRRALRARPGHPIEQRDAEVGFTVFGTMGPRLHRRAAPADLRPLVRRARTTARVLSGLTGESSCL